ncbi:citryl-CoA lyase [Achromobacter denitrificans]
MAEQRKYWKTSIAEATDEGMIIRGYDVLEDLVGKIDFGALVYLLYKGELPQGNESKMINALFICSAEHGISPSSTVTRFVQAAGVPIQCAIAAGAMMFGDVHGGAGQEFSRLIQQLVADSAGKDFDQVAHQFVRAHKRIDGYGHPQHPSGDPRGKVLFDLAQRYGLAGEHIRMARAIERALVEKTGRPLLANIDAAIGAIISDMGFDWRVARAFIVVPRTAGLFAHAAEEQVREPGWRQITLDQIEYDGPARRTHTGGAL